MGSIIADPDDPPSGGIWYDMFLAPYNQADLDSYRYSDFVSFVEARASGYSMQTQTPSFNQYYDLIIQDEFKEMKSSGLQFYANQIELELKSLSQQSLYNMDTLFMLLDGDIFDENSIYQQNLKKYDGKIPEAIADAMAQSELLKQAGVSTIEQLKDTAPAYSFNEFEKRRAFLRDQFMENPYPLGSTGSESPLDRRKNLILLEIEDLLKNYHQKYQFGIDSEYKRTRFNEGRVPESGFRVRKDYVQAAMGMKGEVAFRNFMQAEAIYELISQLEDLKKEISSSTEIPSITKYGKDFKYTYGRGFLYDSIHNSTYGPFGFESINKNDFLIFHSLKEHFEKHGNFDFYKIKQEKAMANGDQRILRRLVLRNHENKAYEGSSLAPLVRKGQEEGDILKHGITRKPDPTGHLVISGDLEKSASEEKPLFLREPNLFSPQAQFEEVTLKPDTFFDKSTTQVGTSTAIQLTGNQVPIASAKNFEIKNINVDIFYEGKIYSIEPKDYIIKHDYVEGYLIEFKPSAFEQLGDGYITEKVTAKYEYFGKQRKASSSRDLDKVTYKKSKIKEVIAEMRKAGLNRFANDLDEYITNYIGDGSGPNNDQIPVEEVSRWIRTNTKYTFNFIPHTGDIEKINVYSQFKIYENDVGVLCWQCDGANNFNAYLFDDYFIDSEDLPGLRKGVLNGFSYEGGEEGIIRMSDRHRKSYLAQNSSQAINYHDVTPSQQWSLPKDVAETSEELARKIENLKRQYREAVRYFVDSNLPVTQKRVHLHEKYLDMTKAYITFLESKDENRLAVFQETLKKIRPNSIEEIDNLTYLQVDAYIKKEANHLIGVLQKGSQNGVFNRRHLNFYGMVYERLIRCFKKL